MKVVWSEAALDDFDRLIAFVADKNPDAAARIVTRIDRVVRELGGFRTGWRGRVPGTYEKLVPGLPYTVAYAVAPVGSLRENVVILRIIHGARHCRSMATISYARGGRPEEVPDEIRLG